MNCSGYTVEAQEVKVEAQEVKVVAQCISTGVVVEHEYGYRAEKCRIEQMWLVTPRPCAKGHSVKLEPGRYSSGEPSDWVFSKLHLAWVNTKTGRVVDDLDMKSAVLSPFVINGSQAPHWECSEERVEHPGAAYAQVLSTKYGVPCTSMPVSQFIAKLDEGSL
jgi:hypothetical protein